MCVDKGSKLVESNSDDNYVWVVSFCLSRLKTRCEDVTVDFFDSDV